MPEERRPSIDERLQAMKVRMHRLAEQGQEQESRSKQLHEEVMNNDREWQRFRLALRSGLQAYRSGIGEH